MADHDLTLAEVAERRRMTPRQLRDFVRRREIPVLTTGRQLRFDRDALIAVDDAMRSRPLTPSERVFRDALWDTAAAETQLSDAAEVYFIAAAGTVKIGVAVDPFARMATLQIGSPITLRFIGALPGGAELERRLHNRFSAHRIRGEWFRLEGALAAFIRERFGDA